MADAPSSPEPVEGRRRASWPTGVTPPPREGRLRAEKIWDYNAFLDYCDRWMYDDDTEFLATIQKVRGWDYSGSPQGRTWDRFVDDMWARYRTAPGMPPTDGWKMGPPGDVAP